MPQVVADRFVRCADAWIDLGTGRTTKLRILPAGSRNEQIVWNTQCAVLANLRHPLINPLIDYGLIDSQHRFEAYAAQPAIRVSIRAANHLKAHGLRFLQSHGVPLGAVPSTRAIERSLRTSRSSSFRPLGVVLQPRAVYDAIADALEVAWPSGPAVIFVGGSLQSGLRTARVIAARLARLRGYVPVDAEVLERQPSFAAFTANRHVCVLADERQAAAHSVTMLLRRLGSEGPRRHVVLVFVRPPSGPPHRWIAIDRMGVTAMSAMIFVDHVQGPSPAEILSAIRLADGTPGALLQRLGSNEYAPIRTSALVVHETTQPYDTAGSAAQFDQTVTVTRRSDALLQRSMARADALVVRGRHAVASRLLSRASRVLLGRGLLERAAETAVHHGFLLLDRGLLTETVAAFERARQSAPASQSALHATIGLGLVLIDQGRLVEAEAVLRTTVVSPGDDRRLRVQGACALARCLYWMGRLDEARLTLDAAPIIDAGPETVRLMALRARIELAEDLIAPAVRTARGAVDLATELRDLRTLAVASRSLAAALASAGDERAAIVQIEQGLAAAATAHLPLAAARLRLTHAEIGGAPYQQAARKIVSRLMTPRYPPLLQASARAALSRIEGRELDARTRSFMTSSGAAGLARSPLAILNNPVTDLESFLDVGHTAPDDRIAIERIAHLLQSKLRAATVIIVATAPERRMLSISGRPWQGDPHVAWRAAGAAVGVPVDPSVEPCQAAEPIRYSNEVIGAVAVRWTAGVAIDSPRTSSMLRIASLAVAAHVRCVLDQSMMPAAKPSADDLLGDSQPACTLREAIARAARAPFPVLIQGESGSGKELVARTIHRLGSRRDRRFCALNCAALTDELIEAELFGHARGAFTGAVGERAGLFEEADGGTLFLDEIGELSARAQAKLLRVLQDGEVRRVGENLSRRVDVRIVAATNRRLEQEAAAGRFRLDLRFRLDVIRIEVPPLRDRASDVPALVSRFWTEAAGRVGSRATLGPEAVALLARYEWPGNVRELQNVIAWIAVQSPRRGRIGAASLPSHIASVCATSADHTTFEAARQEFERRFVKAALAKADGQRARAAEALGITRQGLAKMMRRLGLE